MDHCCFLVGVCFFSCLLLLTKNLYIFILSCPLLLNNLSCGRKSYASPALTKDREWAVLRVIPKQLAKSSQGSFQPRHMMTHLISEREQKHSVPLTALSGKMWQAALRTPARALSCSDTWQQCILHKEPALWRTRVYWEVLNLDWCPWYKSPQPWSRRQVKVFSQNLVKGSSCLRTRYVLSKINKCSFLSKVRSDLD